MGIWGEKSGYLSGKYGIFSVIFRSYNFKIYCSIECCICYTLQLKMAETQSCQVLCASGGKPVVFDAKESKLVAKRIKQEYNVHL